MSRLRILEGALVLLALGAAVGVVLIKQLSGG